MSKIPEGATHTYAESTGKSYRKKMRDGWAGYADGDWILLSCPAPHCYEPIQADPEWTGEGLPPVGIVCLLSGPSETLDPLHPEWAGREVKIYAHFRSDNGRYLAAYVGLDNMIGGVGVAELFKPNLTPEQIAADERLHKIRNACTDISKTFDRLGLRNDIPGGGVARAVIEAMIDAGYAKQVEK